MNGFGLDCVYFKYTSRCRSKLQCIAYQRNAVNLGGGGTVGSGFWKNVKGYPTVA